MLGNMCLVAVAACCIPGLVEAQNVGVYPWGTHSTVEDRMQEILEELHTMPFLEAYEDSFPKSFIQELEKSGTPRANPAGGGSVSEEDESHGDRSTQYMKLRSHHGSGGVPYNVVIEGLDGIIADYTRRKASIDQELEDSGPSSSASNAGQVDSDSYKHWDMNDLDVGDDYDDDDAAEAAGIYIDLDKEIEEEKREVEAMGREGGDPSDGKRGQDGVRDLHTLLQSMEPQEGVTKDSGGVEQDADDSSGSPLCIVFPAGWWNYEWCHRSEVKQFHLQGHEDVGYTNVGLSQMLKRDPVFSLGRYERTMVVRKGGDPSDESAPIIKVVDVYTRGQKLEERRNSYRSTEVHIQCCEGGIGEANEPQPPEAHLGSGAGQGSGRNGPTIRPDPDNELSKEQMERATRSEAMRRRRIRGRELVRNSHIFRKFDKYSSRQSSLSASPTDFATLRSKNEYYYDMLYGKLGRSPFDAEEGADAALDEHGGVDGMDDLVDMRSIVHGEFAAESADMARRLYGEGSMVVEEVVSAGKGASDRSNLPAEEARFFTSNDGVQQQEALADLEADLELIDAELLGLDAAASADAEAHNANIAPDPDADVEADRRQEQMNRLLRKKQAEQRRVQLNQQREQKRSLRKALLSTASANRVTSVPIPPSPADSKGRKAPAPSRFTRQYMIAETGAVVQMDLDAGFFADSGKGHRKSIRTMKTFDMSAFVPLTGSTRDNFRGHASEAAAAAHQQGLSHVKQTMRYDAEQGKYVEKEQFSDELSRKSIFVKVEKDPDGNIIPREYSTLDVVEVQTVTTVASTSSLSAGSQLHDQIEDRIKADEKTRKSSSVPAVRPRITFKSVTEPNLGQYEIAVCHPYLCPDNAAYSSSAASASGHIAARASASAAKSDSSAKSQGGGNKMYTSSALKNRIQREKHEKELAKSALERKRKEYLAAQREQRRVLKERQAARVAEADKEYSNSLTAVVKAIVRGGKVLPGTPGVVFPSPPGEEGGTTLLHGDTPTKLLITDPRCITGGGEGLEGWWTYEVCFGTDPEISQNTEGGAAAAVNSAKADIMRRKRESEGADKPVNFGVRQYHFDRVFVMDPKNPKMQSEKRVVAVEFSLGYLEDATVLESEERLQTLVVKRDVDAGASGGIGGDANSTSGSRNQFILENNPYLRNLPTSLGAAVKPAPARPSATPSTSAQGNSVHAAKTGGSPFEHGGHFGSHGNGGEGMGRHTVNSQLYASSLRLNFVGGSVCDTSGDTGSADAKDKSKTGGKTAAAQHVPLTEEEIKASVEATTEAFREAGMDPGPEAINLRTQIEAALRQAEVERNVQRGRDLAEEEAAAARAAAGVAVVEVDVDGDASAPEAAAPAHEVTRRSSSVELFCGDSDTILSVLEDYTCHYIIKVSSTVLCKHSAFKPRERKVVRLSLQVGEDEGDVAGSADEAHGAEGGTEPAAEQDVTATAADLPVTDATDGTRGQSSPETEDAVVNAARSDAQVASNDLQQEQEQGPGKEKTPSDEVTVLVKGLRERPKLPYQQNPRKGPRSVNREALKSS